MTEIKKRKIVIASVLKPVNDTRMSEKIARSLAETNQYEVHVIGFPGLETSDTKPLFYSHLLPYFKRLSLHRLIMPWKVMAKTMHLKPDLLIITTHELLIISMLIKLFIRCKVIYDIQENYYRNINHTPAFPFFLRPMIAAYVRLKEVIASPFVDHFFLAEAGYQNEISFPGKNFTVLENKVKFPVREIPLQRDRYQLLFSGTLAETTGVFEAIELAKKLNLVEPKIELTIIGYCAQLQVLKKINEATESFTFIKVIGGNVLVPHDDVISQILCSGAGIVSYPNNPATQNSIPTKLYEYLGYHLPVILRSHTVWENLCSPYDAAIVYNPSNIDVSYMLQALKNRDFYSKNPNNVYWEDEEPKLIRQIHLLVN